jgi:hypothetical protein
MRSSSGDPGSGPANHESSSEEDVTHATSIAVWDLTSPVVVGHRPTLKVGVSCASGCRLSGSAVDVCDDRGDRVAAGRLGSAPWPATAALYWVELDLAAPEREGDLSLSIHATPTLPHAAATSVLTVNVSAPPEHRVTLRVIDKTAGTPLAGVELRIGRFRTASDAIGIASVELPGGTYEIGTWKNGYDIVSKTVVIGADTTIDLELTAAREPDQPYWM